MYGFSLAQNTAGSSNEQSKKGRRRERTDSVERQSVVFEV